ncbi:uncharacterized protein [Nicotiana sylvestris]|uniref:uncharacterized protein n=1 Tax=Nicotiana sylvestris TaxID=4096 RepID=UPI00388C46C0
MYNSWWIRGFYFDFHPLKGVMRFGKKVKFSPWDNGPFEVLERVDKDLTYVDESVAILEKQVQKLWSKNFASVKDFDDVFPEDIPKVLSHLRGIYHQIDFVPGAQIPNRSAYRSNPKETKDLQRQVEELLKKRFMRESMSPCTVLILYVPKKDETWRMCTDHRAINKITMLVTRKTTASQRREIAVEFTGTDQREDPQDFIDQLHRIFRVMHAIEKEEVELAAFRLRDVAILWYEGWERSRGRDAPPAIWENFLDAFLDKYLPREIQQARLDQFIALKQGNMSVREYSLHFDTLTRYAPSIVATMQDRINRFIAGLAPELTEACATAVLPDSMDISWIVAFAQNIERCRHRQQITERTESWQHPGSTLSCITPFVARKFGIVPEIISDPFAVSTSVRESIIARFVYRGCAVSVCGRHTSTNLVELEMLDFDAIMGMDWLAACYAIVDCRAKAARFHFPGEPILEWVGNTATPRGGFISYLKVRKMITKGYIYNIVRVKDADAEIPILQSIPVVKEYADVFLIEFQKANVVADTLSRRSMGSLAPVEAEKRQLTREIHQLACLGVSCVPDAAGLRDRIVSEAHYSWYSIHPGSTKMYHDVKEVYWWNDMKKNIVYVAECPSFQQVKIEHQKPGGLM